MREDCQVLCGPQSNTELRNESSPGCSQETLPEVIQFNGESAFNVTETKLTVITEG